MEKMPPKLAIGEFEIKKRKYFGDLALSVKSAFKLHKIAGQLREDGGEVKRPWGNVSEHCLVEIARVSVLADLLGLGVGTKRELMYAAALHDISKRREKELPVVDGGITWEQYDTDVGQWTAKKIREAGFSEQIVELSDAPGHAPLAKAEELLAKDSLALNDDEKAYLVMHYVDGYTRGSELVQPASSDRNEIDLRAAKNKNNPTLRNLIRDGRVIYNGRDYNDIMREVGHKIEHLFVYLISLKQSDIQIEPIHLPEFIDSKIKEQINAI